MLRRCGTPIISKSIRVRCPDAFEVGEFSVVDDFCYFSSRVFIKRFAHVASGCSVAGGTKHVFVLGDYSSLSSGVKIWCGSDDFVNDVVAILPPWGDGIKDHFIQGDVVFENYTAAGANSVVMPDNHVPEGTVIGALSFVPPRFKFKPWTVYAGVPVRAICARNRANALRQVRKIEMRLKSNGISTSHKSA